MQNAGFEIEDINKSFPGVKALNNVSLSVERGEIRALVGENGAGKSTLLKILNGNFKMDSGNISIDGRHVDITSPVIAAKLGISIIFQELSLINVLSVAENIFIGRMKNGKGGLINWKNINSKAKEVLGHIGFDIDPKTEVGKLSIASKQMVEIARALSHNASIILMDEPSATLTKTELDLLFKIIRDLKAKNITVIYVSHRLEEIFEICDSVTILRDGNVIETGKISEFSRDQIISKMVGREIEHNFPTRLPEIGPEVLHVENLCRRGANQSISFSLHRGEVLGIAGLVGSGRTEIMRALYGIDYTNKGEILINDSKKSIKSPIDAKKVGIAFLTEDRKEEGLVMDFTVKSNIVMASLNKITTHRFLDNKKEKDTAKKFVELINIKTPSINQKVEYLSGGNQQKVVISKWLNTDADIFIMDEPTRGIDVGAKYEIYLLINKLAKEGKAIIFISSELPEVLAMSDRVLVMKENSINAELTGSEITAVNVMKYAI